jgi:hypothetical protein
MGQFRFLFNAAGMHVLQTRFAHFLRICIPYVRFKCLPRGEQIVGAAREERFAFTFSHNCETDSPIHELDPLLIGKPGKCCITLFKSHILDWDMWRLTLQTGIVSCCSQYTSSEFLKGSKNEQ